MIISSGLGLDAPVTIGRDAARDAAREELSKRVYDEAQPPLLVRAVEWMLERLQDIVDRIGAAAPGGWYAVLVLLAILAAASYAVVRGIGPVVSTTAARHPVFGAEARRSSAGHRASADDAQARGDWATAVRERYRAIVRMLEERGLLDERPGCTADEAAAEGGIALPSVQAGLRSGARIFDEIMYGGHPATRHHDDELQVLDEAVRRARPLVAP